MNLLRPYFAASCVTRMSLQPENSHEIGQKPKKSGENR
jgi:hypothetical protein